MRKTVEQTAFSCNGKGIIQKCRKKSKRPHQNQQSITRSPEHETYDGVGSLISAAERGQHWTLALAALQQMLLTYVSRNNQQKMMQEMPLASFGGSGPITSKGRTGLRTLSVYFSVTKTVENAS